MTETRRARAASWIVALVAAPALAGLLGSSSGRAIRLNLGPGDRPFVSGFQERYEIDENVATHWTSNAALVRLPLALDGGGELSYRYARVLPETAQVDVSFGGRIVDRFACRGGAFETRKTPVGGDGSASATVAFAIDSHATRRLGLKLDWLQLQPAAGARVRLIGASRWRAALLVAVLLCVLRLAGLGLAQAALLAAPVSLLATLGLRSDPWLTFRLLTGVPELLLAAGGLGVMLGRRLVVRGVASPDALRALAALCCAAFLIRAAAVNHPAFYHPDLRTHARLVEVVADAGLDFFVHPARYIAEHGVWLTEAYGKQYAFPYSPAFHLPFAALGLARDDLLSAMKLWAVALSVVPVVLIWALARRLGASVLGAALMLLIPSYTSRLSFAFLPALFGHAFDMGLLLYLSARLDQVPSSRRTFLQGAALVGASQLAYVSGVVNVSLLVAVLALLVALERPPSVRRGASILAMGLLGSALALALYYRGFLEMVADVVPRIAAGQAAAPSRYPVLPFLAVVAARTHDFFGGVYPVLALSGLVTLLVRGRRRSLLLAWALTYFLLLLGRAKVPDLFLHGHETLLATPLVCLLAGEALAGLWRTGRLGRVATASTLLFLAYQGLRLQWLAVASQLGNAL